MEEKEKKFREMKVGGLTVDPYTNTPIVLLKDLEEKDVVPIWIGFFEASAIATQLENVKLARPMTHDLMR
ncbi:MAG TPA: bifunctional nuclease family protein, partial [Deltaproteobacteria bacterium]|nr:bifunctional nuclease family protein [Deltaproteobacteria bacterium]